MEHETETGELTSNERAALDAWVVAKPNAGFRDRVMARLEAERAPMRRVRPLVWGALAAAALVAIVVGVTLVVRGSRVADEGQATASDRTTARIGHRAVAVLEPASAIRWGHGDRGGLRVEQASGNVFYRVEDGSAFEVIANDVRVRVTGTCFRVEVTEMKAKTAGAIGTSVGAMASAVVLVTVYEGRVVTASPKGESAVIAGQVAVVRADSPPVVHAASVTSNVAALGGALAKDANGAREHEATRADARAVTATGDARTEREARLEAKTKKLEQEVETLRAEVARAGKGGALPYDKKRPHELTQEDLVRMAKECRLVWEHPNIHASGHPKVTKKQIESAGLTEVEVALTNEVLRTTNQSLLEKTRAFYRELTGDETVGSLSAEAMHSEIWDKTPGTERQRIFRRIAREKAGLENPPTSLGGTTPFERLMRMMTSIADSLEREIGGKIGPDLARRLRETGGAAFGSRSSSSPGCPEVAR